MVVTLYSCSCLDLKNAPRQTPISASLSPSSASLSASPSCLQISDNNQSCPCLSFAASTLDQVGPHSSSPAYSRAHFLPAHLRLVWTWYSCAPRLCFNVCASLPCDELRCILSEGRCSLVVVSVIMFMHFIADAPGTSVHMLGVSHRAYTGHKCVSFAYASALRRECHPFQCRYIHRQPSKHPVHSDADALSLR